MKKWLWVFILFAFLSLFCMLINMFITPLPDWLVRAAGVAALICVAEIAFTAVRNKRA